MFRWLRKIFAKSIRTADISGTYTDYTNILNTSFNNKEDLIVDLVQHIVSNDFVISPAHILVIYKDKYDFSLDEFLVLVFKLGMISRSYIDKPATLLEDASTLNSIYSPETINDFKKLLKAHADNDEIRVRALYAEYIKNEKAINKDDADKQIDDWLAKNKKVDDDKEV